MTEQLLERNASSDLSADSRSEQQFRQPEKTEKSFNDTEHRQAYHPIKQSFNEQRDQYTEQAFHANVPEISPSSLSPVPPPDPPEAPASTHTHPAYDSSLNKLMQKRDAAVNKVDKLYQSIESKEVDKSFSEKARKGERLIPTGMTEHEAAHRLVNERKKRSLKAAAYSRDFHNRLVFKGMEKRLTMKEYDRRSRKDYQKKYVKDIAVRKAVRKGRLLFDNEDAADDDDAAATKRTLRKGARAGQLITRQSIRNIDKKTNKYARLKAAVDKENLLNQKINQNEYKQQKEAAKAIKLKEERKKKMQQARMYRREQEGRFLKRSLNSMKMKKKAAEQKAKRVKSFLSVAFSALMLLLVFLMSNMFLMLFLGIAVSTSAGTYAQTIIPVDYGEMSECTAYYRKLETDLTEKLMDTETLEEEIREEYGDDIYEYIYDLAEINFHSPTLIAYLGAKYVEFTLADVQTELEELFALNYVLHIETKMEYREEAGTDVKICYITLEKVPLEDIVMERLTEEQKQQYDLYKLSTGGQQVYGPVMQEDWTNLISSNYGERIHPITKERTKHNGVDIAVPIGTPLYSAIDGTVIVAQNSSTAGNYIQIQNSTGWTVTFMHMDSFTVAAGDVVKQGDFVGYSGNTGRSTGPHLHLEIRDASKNPVNPIFIVPQNCALIETEENEEN